ncbi:MAG: YhbY family RNA-binding protein [Gammaproteobacteria bacterium]|nr:YhbY family RNA-binding protein [Gammaproteobacteria bacterium]
MDADSKKKLKARAHALKPVVMIGQAGLTDAVLAEIDIALNVHELIKVKIRAEKTERADIEQEVCAKTGAELVQMIGQIAIFYRMNPKAPAKPKVGRPRNLNKTKRTGPLKQRTINKRGKHSY